jgi:hypothetical protein
MLDGSTACLSSNARKIECSDNPPDYISEALALWSNPPTHSPHPPQTMRSFSIYTHTDYLANPEFRILKFDKASKCNWNYQAQEIFFRIYEAKYWYPTLSCIQ